MWAHNPVIFLPSNDAMTVWEWMICYQDTERKIQTSYLSKQNRAKTWRRARWDKSTLSHRRQSFFSTQVQTAKMRNVFWNPKNCQTNRAMFSEHKYFLTHSYSGIICLQWSLQSFFNSSIKQIPTDGVLLVWKKKELMLKCRTCISKTKNTDNQQPQLHKYMRKMKTYLLHHQKTLVLPLQGQQWCRKAITWQKTC